MATADVFQHAATAAGLRIAGYNDAEASQQSLQSSPHSVPSSPVRRQPLLRVCWTPVRRARVSEQMRLEPDAGHVRQGVRRGRLRRRHDDDDPGRDEPVRGGLGTTSVAVPGRPISLHRLLRLDALRRLPVFSWARLGAEPADVWKGGIDHHHHPDHDRDDQYQQRRWHVVTLLDIVLSRLPSRQYTLPAVRLVRTCVRVALWTSEDLERRLQDVRRRQRHVFHIINAAARSGTLSIMLRIVLSSLSEMRHFEFLVSCDKTKCDQ